MASSLQLDLAILRSDTVYMEVGRGWIDVTAEDVTRMAKDNFEELCRDMVDFEKAERHSPKTRVYGGTVDDAGDGGRDVLLDVKAPPEESAAAFQRRFHATPITEDEQVRTAYNCKSGKKWFEGVTRDLKPKKKRKLTSRAIEVVKEGGYLKVWTNLKIAVDKERTFDERSATPQQHFVWVLAQELGEEPKDIEGRVEVLGANELAAWLRAVQPPTLERWLRKLNLEPRLHSVEEWRALHEDERRGPVEFESDTNRDDLRKQLRQRLGTKPSAIGDEQIVQVLGPPGVGKTRLILEVLADNDQMTSTRVAYTAHEALQEFNTGQLLQRYPGALIIVDDCPPDRAADVGRQFIAQAKRGNDQEARLIVLIPASKDVLAELPQRSTLVVEPLSENAASELAAGLTGRPADDELVVGIVRYAEGYPWFAALLAAEAKDLARAPRDMREAVDWALASRHADDRTTGPQLNKLRKLRRRALVAAALTSSEDWLALEPVRQDALAKAVGLESWDQLLTAAEQCRSRGLLRVRLDWKFKYVTPQVLEREVLRSHFRPNGTDPGGRRLTPAMPELATPLAEALERANVGPDEMRAVATVTLDELDSAKNWASFITQPALTTPRLILAARVEPVRTATLLDRQISQAPIEALREAEGARRPLTWTLELLAERRHAFEHSERALFRLALAENESYGNNATAVWVGLFQVELNVTHKPLAQRLAVLERRLGEAPAAGQLLVLDALAATLGPTPFRVVRPQLDGEPWKATRDDARKGRLRAWSLLLAAIDSSAAEVASHARTLVTQQLRAVVWAGIGDIAVRELLQVCTAFTGRDRTRLLEAVETLQRFEGEDGRRVADVLRPALQPQSFAERLLDRVAGFGMMVDEEEQVAADAILAEEGLSDSTLLRHLELVLAPDNPRGLAFLHTAAAHDEGALLLPPLWGSRLSLHGARALSVYLQGLLHAGNMTVVDEAIDALVSAGEPTPLALALSTVGATDERLRALSSAVRSSGVDEAVVAYLRFGDWLADVATDVAAEFLDEILRAGSPTGVAFTLQQSVRRISRDPDTINALSEVLMAALEAASQEQVDGMVDHAWREGCLLLLSVGRVGEVARLACLTVTRKHRAGHYGWSVLAKCSRQDTEATWEALREVLEGRNAATGRFLVRVRHHTKELVLPDEKCMMWVGDDEERARTLSALVSPRGQRLPPVLRHLLIHFGPSGSVARTIAAAIGSTERPVPSLAQFHAAQVAMVQGWANDPSSVVRAFAAEVATGLEHDVERESAFEEAERLRG